MLKITIDNEYDFMNAMYADRRNYFTLDGYRAILDYFEWIDEDVEFDCIGICCDFCEQSWEYVWDDYSNLWDEDEFECEFENGKPIPEDEDEFVDELLNKMTDQTWCVQLDNGNFLYQIF